MPGRIVTFPANGRTAEGYLTIPPSGAGAGVLVLQEWWGLVDHIIDVTDRLAAEGFVALAPDLFHGKKTKSPNEAEKLFMALNIGETSKDLRGAADSLLGMDEVEPGKVGVVGFCMGGQLALYAACEYPDRISAVVDFYGVHPNVKPRVAQLDAPLLAHFATRDTNVPVERAHAFVEGLRDAGKDVEAHFYEADHAFFNDARPEVHDADAARLAWDRTVDFFRRTLR